MTGSSRGNGSGDDYATVKYNGTTGSQSWVARFNGTANTNDVARAIILDSVTNVIVTGSSQSTGTGDDYTTIKYNAATGSGLWTNKYDAAAMSDEANALVVDRANDVYVTGASSSGGASGTDFATIKYSAAGTPVWTNRFSGPGSGADTAVAIAVDNFRNVIVSGSSDGGASGLDFLTVRYVQNLAPLANSQSVTTLEDTPQAITLTASDTNADALTFEVVTQPANGALSGTAPNLTYTPAPNFNGSDSFTFSASDGYTNSPVATVTISVTAVNDAPSFTKGADQSILEDAGPQTVTGWATSISPGPPDESGQTLNFVVSNNNNGLFSAQPAISPSGTLTYTPASNSNGVATVTVQLHDNGGTANGGVDTSPAQTFVITVTPVNDAPSFNLSTTALTVLEDAGAQNVANLATNMSAGPPDELGQALNFIVANNNNGLFSAQPAINPSGTLTYTPAANANGVATVTVQLHDDGGTANGGADTSTAQTFTITVTPVNDAPSFSLAGASLTVDEDAGPQTVTGWATQMSAGPPNESGQTLNFIVTNNNNGLFSVQPAIEASSGTLTYTTAPNSNGVATVSVQLHDNGGTANGGVDTSAPQTFTINVAAVDDAPVVMVQTPQSVLEDQILLVAGLSVFDIDVEEGSTNNQLLLRLTVTNGSLTLNTTTGLTFTTTTTYTTNLLLQVTTNTTVNGPNGTSKVEVTGRMSDLNNALTNLTYNPDPNYNGVDSLQVYVNDQGHTGSGGPLSDTKFVTLSVIVVNDPPVGVDDTLSDVLEDSGPRSIPFATLLSNDSPGPANESTQTLTITSVGSAVGGTVSISSTNVIFTPLTNYNGPASFVYTLQDNGQSGSPPTNDFKTATATVRFNITPVNDAPSFNLSTTALTVLEDAGAQSVANLATNLSAGPADESGQALNFIVVNNNNGLFSSQPAISPSGTLTYTPAANANGVATVTVQLHDNGGTANGGADTSAAQSFTITVTAVNDAPSFTKGPDQTVDEDSGAATVPHWASNFTFGPPDEQSSQSVLAFLVSNNNNGLFSVQPALSTNGTLTYTPAPNSNGVATVTVQLQDNGGTANGGMDTSAPQSFNITVNAVDDAPVATVAVTNQSVLEDQTLLVAGLSVFDIDVEEGSTNNQLLLRLTVTNGSLTLNTTTGLTFTTTTTYTTNLLLQVTTNTTVNGPNGTSKVEVTGRMSDLNNALTNLTYNPAPNYNGPDSLQVYVNDQGHTGSGGPLSDTETVALSVGSVNDAPSFTAGPNQTVNEDIGPQSVNNWATAISAGPPNESGQTLNFIVTNDNTGMFSVQPAIDAGSGTLTYTPAPDSNGVATVTVRLHDNGGTANGGADTSTPQTFTITVNPVNDPPSFTKGVDQTVNEDAGPQAVANWATNIKAGPSNESGQTLNFMVSNDNPGLFSAQPAVDATTGTLTYTPATDSNGVATVTVRLHDDGGTASGGSDTSDPQTFIITVTSVNDAPAFTKGADQSVLEDTGSHTAANWARNMKTGPPNESGQALNFIVTNDNTGMFSVQPTIDATSGDLTYTLAPDSNGVATVTVRLHDNGGTANGGSDTSPPQTFTITVTPVNDQPSFTKGPDQTADENAGPQTVPHWASNFVFGPPDEQSSQAVLAFLVNNNSNVLFSAQPAIDTNGTLTFTPAANTHGVATVTVRMQDNGGTADGGVDTSALQTFNITVAHINGAPQPAPDTLNACRDVPLRVRSNHLLANDTDPDADPLTIVSVSPSSAHGTVTLSDDHQLVTYQPELDYLGVDTFTYTVSDGRLTATTSVTVNVVPPFSGDPAGVWTNRYNGPNNGIDTVTAMAVDAAGNVFVTGYSDDGLMTGNDFATIKYDAAGHALWTNRFNGPANGDDRAFAIGVDTNGDVFVTGASQGIGTGTDYATLKIHGITGTNIWVARYNGPGNGNDQASAMAVDAAGNVFVTGSSVGTVAGTNDFATIKYNGADGSGLWTNRYNGPGNGNDQAAALALDRAANVVVTGISEGAGTGPDYATIKIDGATGINLWVARYDNNGNLNAPDIAHALALDSDGNVYVTGSSFDSDKDYLTVKYDAQSGVQLWEARYIGLGSGDDEAQAIAVDVAGNVYVTGTSSGDFATLKYDTDGNPLWSDAARYNGPGNGNDQGLALVVDRACDVYVAGGSAGTLGDSDFAAVKYDAITGAPVWTNEIRYNGSGNGSDVAVAVAVDQVGNVFVGGSSTGAGTSLDYTVLRFFQNLPPTISDFSDQAVVEDTSTGPIPFTVGDSFTSASDLTVSGTSSNTTLVPLANIVFGGSGSNRTVTITPGTHQYGATPISISVSDGLSTVTKSFLLTVNYVNYTPILTAIPDRTINEMELFTFTNTASDVDTDTLTFSLGTNAPAGASVNPTNGVFTWTPTEEQGPSTNLITVVVTDNGSPSRSDSKSFTVIVREVNRPPALASVPDRTNNTGVLITFTNHATDPDIPSNNLYFSLTRAPAGASVTPVSGVFNWRPMVSQAGSSNFITVRVTDDGSPPMYDEKSFTTIVNPLSQVRLTPLSRTNGHFVMSVTGDVGPDYTLQASTNFTDWTNLQTVTPASTPFTFMDTNAVSFRDRFYRVLLGP